MADFYDILGVSEDASPSEIRSAYKKKALKTHPDRAPPEAKSDAEVRFRELGEAYEVLNDETTRKLYDQYKVWPIPQTDGMSSPEPSDFGDFLPRQPRFPGHPHFHPSPDHFPPMFMHHHFPHHHPPSPLFSRDPFELFDSLFESSGAFGDDPWRPPSWRHRGPMGPFGVFPPFRAPFALADDPFFPERRVGPSSRHDLGPRVYVESSSARGFFGRGMDDGPGWIEESRMTRSVNGVSQTVWRRKDTRGHEHVTYTYPDGTQRYTLDGVEQKVPNATRRIAGPPEHLPGHGHPPHTHLINTGHSHDLRHSHEHHRPHSHPYARNPPLSINSYYEPGSSSRR